MIAHDLLQRLRCPVLVKVDLESLGRFDFAQHAANLREKRARSGLRACVVQKPPAANVAYQLVHPAPDQQPEHESEEQREHRRGNTRQREHIVARRGLAAIDETQVMHDERGDRPAVCAAHRE